MNDQNPFPKPPSSHLDRLVERTNEESQSPSEPASIEQNPENTGDLHSEKNENAPVTILFDESSTNYIPGIDMYNLEFVRTAANVLNQQLQTRGHLFLNDVHDYLKVKRTPEGQLLGWIATDDAPARINIEVTQVENGYLLTPDVQGNIQELI